MIEFKQLDPARKAEFTQYLTADGERGCEYSFINLFLWGRQKAALLEDHLVIMSQYDRRCVYPFPRGNGDVKPVLDAIIHDAAVRGVPCCLSSMNAEDCEALERLYPGAFRFYTARENFDYVYDINDLADLKGRKYQKKRNHIHRFQAAYPDWRVEPLSQQIMPLVADMLEKWYTDRKAADPTANFHLEQLALRRAFRFRELLGLEGIALMDGDRVLAFTMGSRLNNNTYDIHFEKALEDADGAYPAINQEFARYLRQQHPDVQFLNREDDLGLEGLRKAKLSYYPHHMVEKYWVCLWEVEDDR